MQVPFVQFVSVFALRVVVAIAAVLVGRYLAGKARDLTKKTLKRPEVDEALSSSVESILVRVSYYGTLLVTTIFALVILGVPAGAILSVSSVTLVILAVALRESLSNFAAAVIFMIYQPFYLGEEIETMGHRGIVKEIQLFNTVVRQSDRSLAILPNGDIQKSGLTNYSRLGIRRVDLPFTLRYHADMDKARSVIMNILMSDPRVLKHPPPAVVPIHMGDNGLEMQARSFVRYDDYDPVKFSFLQLITQRLLEAGIEPAVTQHDVRMSADSQQD